MSDRSTTYPYNTVVYLIADYGSFSLQGSGVLISPDEVLTASHMVYQQEVGPALSTTVSPGFDGGAAPYGTVAGTPTYYNPLADANGTLLLSDSQQDYAVIHLASPLWDVGTMAIQPDFAGGQVSVTGYPAANGGAQVTSVQTVAPDPSFTLLDGQMLGAGSSGGPVWIDTPTGPAVVGVVSSGDAASGAGYSTQITSAALSQISARVALDDARLHATSTDDYNGDGYSDLTWQQGGVVVQWDMAGASVIAGGGVTSLDPSWSFLGSGDLQGMGRSAMLWRDPSGLVHAWQMGGTSIVSTTPVAVMSPDWHMLATGNFNGTGKSGLLWQNDAGLVKTWRMEGPAMVSDAVVGAVDPSWRFIAAGDLEGDGTADAVWQDASGTLVEWQLNGGTLASAAVIGSLDSSWKFFAGGDFNGDGRTDLIWEHADGGLTAWMMNGSTIVGAGSPGIVAPDCSVVGTGDYNRDGRSDLMLRTGNGAITEWVMDGSTILGAANVATLDASWKPLV